MADTTRRQYIGGRPLSLEAVVRLLNAAKIPQYSPEAVSLIRTALEMRLPPPELRSDTDSVPRDAFTEGDAAKLVEHGNRVFGRILTRCRHEVGLKPGRLADEAGLAYGDIRRLERGLCKPPQGDVLLRLMRTLEIQPNSTEAVEFVSAAALPHLDNELLSAMSVR